MNESMQEFIVRRTNEILNNVPDECLMHPHFARWLAIEELNQKLDRRLEMQETVESLRKLADSIEKEEIVIMGMQFSEDLNEGSQGVFIHYAKTDPSPWNALNHLEYKMYDS